VRIRDAHLVPYLNIRSRYNLYDKEKVNSALYNRFRHYTDGEIENNFEFNTKYNVTDSLDFFGEIN
jgi:hypothetical protein